MVSPNEYLKDRESILVEHQLSGQESLICTDARLVHFADNEVTDFDIDSINVIQSKRSPFPPANLIASILSGLMGISLVLDPSIVGPLADASQEVPVIAGVLLLLLSGIALFEGYQKYGNELIVATPAGRYEFEATDNIEDIAHAVRGAQQ